MTNVPPGTRAIPDGVERDSGLAAGLQATRTTEKVRARERTDLKE
jgi:hypothetical protein